MDELEKKIESLRRLISVLGKRKYQDGAIEGMLSVLSTVSSSDLDQAVDYILRHMTEIPSVAEIIDGIESGLYRSNEVVIDSTSDWNETRRLMDMADLGMNEEEYSDFIAAWEEEGGPYESPGGFE